MGKTMTVENWEKEKGMFLRSIEGVDLNKSVTEEAFDELISTIPGNMVGVNFNDRVKFLQHNEYAVTRENLMDSSLSHKIVKEDEEAEV